LQAATEADRALVEILETQGISIVDSCEDAIVVRTLDGRIVYWNPAAERIYGYSEGEVIGKSISTLFPPERLDELSAITDKILLGERVDHFETVRVRKDGARITTSITVSPILDESGTVVGASAVSRDMSEARRTEQTSRQHDAHLRLLIEQAPVIIWTTDTELLITSAYGSALATLHLKPEHLVGKTLQEFLGRTDPTDPTIAGHLKALKEGRADFENHRAGRTFHVTVEQLRDHDGDVVGCVGVAVDISERKSSEERVRYLATHDPLTDLTNYRALLDAFDTELRRSERTGRPFAVLLLDLDGLKRINDTRGHLAGSQALCRVARVLKHYCRSIDTASRYGGDEFTLLLAETGRSAALHVADRIRKQLVQDEEEPRLEVSLGVAVYREDGHTMEALLEAADRMLYLSRTNSRYGITHSG
jgi:diguanylate cyclase (GGDEF)-like protein/PAS domain S-box-containing protein